MFRRGILDSLSFFSKVCVTDNSKKYVCDIGDTLLNDTKIYRREIEPEILSSKHPKLKLLDDKIIAQASDVMSRISLINKSIEVLHPGNTGRYTQQNTEYGVN